MKLQKTVINDPINCAINYVKYKK